MARTYRELLAENIALRARLARFEEDAAVLVDAATAHRSATPEGRAALGYRLRMAPRVRGILRGVSKDFGISVEAILGKSRTRAVAWARHITCYRLRYAGLNLSFPEVGAIVNRDHTTARTSVVLIEKHYADQAVQRPA